MIERIESAAAVVGGLGSGVDQGRWFKYPLRAEIQQDAVLVRAEAHDGRISDVVVGWDGSVGVIFVMPDRVDRPVRGVANSDGVRRAWTAGLDVLAGYGASGDVHVALATWDRGPDDPVEVHRWTSVRPPSEAELASVQRELERAMGVEFLEDGDT
jgi:hypothetical protein